jgi:hypothetical protein
MTDAIQVTPGYNNPGSLQTVTPSPSISGVQYPRKLNATDGTVFFDGAPFAVLKFPDMIRPDDAVTVLSLFGLSTSGIASVRVTIRLPDENMRTFSIWNAIAVRWNYGVDISYDLNDWYKSPILLLRKLVPI